MRCYSCYHLLYCFFLQVLIAKCWYVCSSHNPTLLMWAHIAKHAYISSLIHISKELTSFFSYYCTLAYVMYRHILFLTSATTTTTTLTSCVIMSLSSSLSATLCLDMPILTEMDHREQRSNSGLLQHIYNITSCRIITFVMDFLHAYHQSFHHCSFAQFIKVIRWAHELKVKQCNRCGI